MNLKWRTKGLLFLSGFLIFSPILSKIFIDIIGLPLTIPEILFLPFIGIYNKYLGIKLSSKFLGSLFFLYILLVIAIIYGYFPFYSVLSTFRGYLYIILAFWAFKDRQLFGGIDAVFAIVLGSSFGWLVMSLNFFSAIVFGSAEGSFAVYGNMISLAMVIVISVLYYKRLFNSIVLIMNLVLSFTTGLRRQILVTLVSYLISLFLLGKRSIKGLIIILLTLGFGFPLILRGFENISSFILTISPKLFSRIITKTTMFIDGEQSTSDSSRLVNLKDVIENIHEYILPRGFVSKRTMADADLGAFMDAPFKELLHTFGLILLIPMLLIFLYRIRFHIINFRKYNVRESGVMIVMSLIFLILTFVEGSFLNFTYSVPVTGFVLGRIFTTKNLLV